jgi:hypothetical protein
MDIIVGSSRARYLGQDGKTLNVVTWYKSGGRIRDMEDLIDQHLLYNPVQYAKKDYVYVVCGVCDITRKVKNYSKHYQEIIYDYDPSENIERMKQDYHHLTSYIYSRRLVPVISTVIPTHLETANHYLLEKNKTRYLAFESDYLIMQQKVLTVCKDINAFISDNNRERGVNTPALHDLVIHNKKKGRKNFKYSELFDGVHANEHLTNLMNVLLKKTITLNRK